MIRSRRPFAFAAACVLVSLALCASPVLAADLSKFTGTWVVDVDRALEESQKSPNYAPGIWSRTP